MKKFMLKPLKKLAWIALFGVALWSCQDENDDPISPEQARVQTQVTASDNNEIIAATQETMEITSGVFADEGISDGRASTGGRISNDDNDGHHDDDDDDDDGDDDGDNHHHACRPSISGSFNLDRSHKDSLIYTGTIIIDYGDGSTCDSAHVRKGKITDTFSYLVTWGDSLTFSSTETITFEGFVKDSVQIDGTFIISASTGNPRTVEAQGAKITYPDGTSVSWDGILSFTYKRGGYCRWKDNTITVSGSISGINREGAAFSWVITEDLVFKYKCDRKRRFRPVSGTVDVTIGGVLSTVDFGDGECDKKYTITAGGETTEHEFGEHHD